MKYTYIIRSCNEDMTSRNGFLWPASGQIVKAHDFRPTNECGNGLHGLRLNQNNPGQWYEDGKLLLLKVDEKKIVDLDGKCKFPEAIVIKTFDDMTSLTSYLYNKNINIEGMYRRTQISDKSVKWIGGNYSTLTGGYDSILTGGISSKLTGGTYSKLTGGRWSTLTGGDGSTLTGGNCSTLTGGNGSILTGGDDSTLSIQYLDGNKYRIAIAYVGENGILPNVKYKVDNEGKFVKV